MPAASRGPGPSAAAVAAPELGVRIGAPAWTARDWVGRDTYTAAFAQPIPTTRIALETSLNDAIGIADRTRIADVVITTARGGRITFPLLAGRDTAERGHDRPSVLPIVRHARATIASSDGLDHTYTTTLTLARPASIASLAVTWRGADPDHGYLTIDRISLDDGAGTDYPVTPRTMLERDPADWQRVDVAAPILVFANRHPYGRAWLLNDVVPATSSAARAARASAAFDPAREATAAGATALHTRASATDRARIDELTASRMTLAVSCATSCYLVTSDAYDAGWSARIDGRSSPVYRTDDALRGVFVPAGTHRVTFRYRPAGLALGVAISLASAFALGMLVFADARRRLR
jgi:hypothetical protein